MGYVLVCLVVGIPGIGVDTMMKKDRKAISLMLIGAALVAPIMHETVTEKAVTVTTMVYTPSGIYTNPVAFPIVVLIAIVGVLLFMAGLRWINKNHGY